MTVTVGFGYKAQHGKDTACRAIVALYGDLFGVRQYAFADELRREIAEAVEELSTNGASRQEGMQRLCQWADVSYDASAIVSAEYPDGKQRALCQWWGTEYRRAQDPDYWVKRLAERIDRERPKFAVISDVRFVNEFDFCDWRVRMDRPAFEIEVGAEHISERQLDVVPAARWNAVISAATAEDVAAEAVRCFGRIYFATKVAPLMRYASPHADPALAVPAR